MVLPKIKISVFGGENGRKPGDSRYKPGYSGFGTLQGKALGIGPETPDLGVRILRVLIRILRKFRMFRIEVRI